MRYGGRTTEEPSAMPRKSTAQVRIAIYSRVSTDSQTTENQERELLAIADRMGWTVVDVYRDHGVSGARARQDRPAFDALCRDATRRKFDMVMAWSVDRLGRSLRDLVAFLSDLHALGIDLFLHQQGVDTTTPAGKALFQMMGVFSEFERSMIRERVKAGLDRAKAQGKRLGRPTIDAATEAAILAVLKAGRMGVMKIAKAHGVGVGTVQRVKTRNGLPSGQ
jgi:DNA invertase Pin-like site-specific DNA recombinase